MNGLKAFAIARPALALRAGAVLLAGLGLALIGLATRREVTLLVDGVPLRWVTHAGTVAGVLRDAGIDLRSDDRVIPDPESNLADGSLIEVRRSRPIRIVLDRQEFAIESTEVLPENILAQAGIRLFPGDRLWVDGLPFSSDTVPPGGPTRLRVERGLPLTLDQAGRKTGLSASAPTLGEALWDAGIRLRSADFVFPGPGKALAGATAIRFSPASPLTIAADDRVVRSWASGRTVGEALADAGLSLTGLDFSEPASEEALPADGRVRVVRVVEVAEMETESLPFGARWEASDLIEIDRQQLVDPGEAGIRAIRTRVRIEDGQPVERHVEPEWVAVQPRDRVMGYGTKIVIRTLDTPGGPIEYWRAVTMYATSYHPCGSAGEPGKCYYGTASGVPVAKGVAAVTVRWFLAMRGQTVYVPNYGKATIADTGGGIPGRYWIDLAYGSREEYVSWHHWVTVYFLTPVPPDHLITWVLP